MRTTAPSARALQLPLFVPLLALYPVIFIAGANPGQVHARDIFIVAVVAATVGLILLSLARLATGSWARAGLLASAVICMFFAYGPVHGYLELGLVEQVEQRVHGAAWRLAQLDLGLSVAWLFVTVILFWGMLRIPVDHARRLTAAVNIAVAILVLLASVQLLASAGKGAAEDSAMAVGQQMKVRPIEATDRDIYYIILDGYARADVLDQHYSYSNEKFLMSLRERGFQVSDASQSNYYWTFLSLASSLNMDYLQSLIDPPLDPKSTDRSVMYGRIRNNEVARFLRANGYRFVHLQSTWGATARNEYADEFVGCHAGLFENEFYRAIAEASWLKVLGSQASGDLAACHLSNIEFLRSAGNMPGPKFVFAHFLPPHHPYLFDEHGNVLRNANITNQFEFQKRLWGRKDLYLGQLAFMNRRMLEVVDALISSSDQPPIVIIQSDHGPQLIDGVDFAERHRARFAILTAALLPEAPQGLLGADITPVNLFRTVFNFYFHANLPLLPSMQYISGFTHPYEFVEFSTDPNAP